MSLKERAALRRKARLLKKELEDQNISELFTNENFTEFVTKPCSELDQDDDR